MKRLLYICLLFSGLSAKAQVAADTLRCPALYRDYQFVKNADPWLTSPNAAALTRFASANIAEAELSLTREKGGLANYYESPDAWQADARVESFCRLNSQTVFYGLISYNSFSGKDMAGSAFISPERMPFDIVEDSLMNTGDKHRDTYRLCGGFGWMAAKGLAVGAQLDYTSANYAKYKDLRHQNKLMDLRLSAGIYVPLARWGAVGAHYLYHRNTESVSFSTYGKSDKTYQSLISYGAFMGHLEQFGNNGFTDKSREMPLVSDCNGAGLQLSAQIGGLSLFNSFTYAHTRGYYGRKSPYTITYANHQVDSYQDHARLTLQTGTSRHSLDMTLGTENLQTDASTYRERQNESGATYYEYYTPVKMGNKLWKDGSLAYTLHLGIRQELPTWTISAGTRWAERRQTAYAFPHARRQKLDSNELFAAIVRHLACTKGVWTLALSGSFLQGKGEPFDDFTLQTPSDKQSAPPTMEAWLYREYQYLTAAQYALGGSVGYAFIMPGTRLKTHATLSLQHRKANETNDYSAGRDRTTVGLAIGCNF